MGWLLRSSKQSAYFEFPCYQLNPEFNIRTWINEICYVFYIFIRRMSQSQREFLCECCLYRLGIRFIFSFLSCFSFFFRRFVRLSASVYEGEYVDMSIYPFWHVFHSHRYLYSISIDINMFGHGNIISWDESKQFFPEILQMANVILIVLISFRLIWLLLLSHWF